MIRSTLLIFLLAFAFNTVPKIAVAQCDSKFEYKIEGSKILIQSNNAHEQATIELFDLRKQVVAKKTERVQFSSLNQWVNVFEGVAPSTYVIIIKYGNCEKILGGLGFNIESKN